MPLVTVVLPTYRRPDLLRRALSSVVAQTLTDFEVLVCDNAGQSEAEEVVRAFGDARLRYIPRRSNLGILGNVRDGMMRARGDYVLELDDDDVLDPECLQLLVEPFASHSDLVVVFGDLRFVDRQGKVLAEAELGLSEPIRGKLKEGVYRPFTELAARGLVSTVTALFLRSAVDWSALPDSAETAFDRYLALAAARGGRGAYYIARPLASYMVHPEADGRVRRIPQLRGALAVFNGELAGAEHRDTAALRSEVVKSSLLLARELGAHGKRLEGIRIVTRLLRRPPSRDVPRVAALLVLPKPVHRELRALRQLGSGGWIRGVSASRD